MGACQKPLKFFLIENRVFFMLSQNYLMYVCDKEAFEMLSLDELDAQVTSLIEGLSMVQPPRTIH